MIVHVLPSNLFRDFYIFLYGIKH